MGRHDPEADRGSCRNVDGELEQVRSGRGLAAVVLPGGVAGDVAGELCLASCGLVFEHPLDGGTVQVAVAEPPGIAELRASRYAAAAPRGWEYEVQRRFRSDRGFYA